MSKAKTDKRNLRGRTAEVFICAVDTYAADCLVSCAVGKVQVTVVP